MITNGNRKSSALSLRALLYVLVSYVFLLLMSYGFPVTGDDYFFTPSHLTGVSFFEPFLQGYRVSAHHYITTNGRLLGNFLVAWTGYSKVLRELVRCGCILGILLCTYFMSGGKSSGFRIWQYLICFALLIAIPATIASQTYSWAAGFFNYVPPTLLILLYGLYLRRLFCRNCRNTSFWWCAGLFLLGLCGAFFMENYSICCCLLSLAAVIMEWIRSKRPHPALLLHFLGALIGCIIMFSAPGYQNVGVEHYREIPRTFADGYDMVQKNFRIMAGFLTVDNYLVVIPLSVFGASACLRRYPQADKKLRRILLALMCLLLCCPLFFYSTQVFGRYYFLLDLFWNALYFLAILFTGIFALKENESRFTVIFCTVVFVLFISPLMLVTPIGARNAYFFDVLMIVIATAFLHAAVKDLPALRPAIPAVCLVCCLLLFGNLWIYYRNGKAEKLRDQIVAQAIERGETEVELPFYPYEAYVHASGTPAIRKYYYNKRPGDLKFKYVTYKYWMETHQQ